MIVQNSGDIKNILPSFKEYNCIVILCKYNGGKSSIITEMIHRHFGEENTCYITFIDQSKPNFTPRKSKLEFNELVKDKVIVFDEMGADDKRVLKNYVKKLVGDNLVIILTNPYGSSQDYEREIQLFQTHERNILPKNTLFVFVKEKSEHI